MAMFNSYVKLPEGIVVVGGSEAFAGWVFAIVDGGGRWQQFCWTLLAAPPFSCAPHCQRMHDISDAVVL